ncbi:serine palmitoyltransferase 1 [Neocloeon triangulifer]|uniref:serine palmitoyltransferase 1 n=1 Tax=Neocloeon triangulifer TaxID=2078957 RepID=UPI00286EE48A|nr:serine palmitoyltransferase 1 [Neocloeon triangulifer]
MVPLDMFHGLFESIKALQHAPVYHLVFEAGLIVWLMWLLFMKSYSLTDKQKLTKKEEQELIDEWMPEPLVPVTPVSSRALHPRIVSSKVGKYIQLGDRQCLNLATHNYLGLIENPKIEEAALKCLSHYGVGSCGPRGFYGTTEVHLDLEDKLAEYMGCEEAVVYSYGFSTIASAIPAYSKRSDVIFVDEMVNFAIQKGLDASRSRIFFFKHNDVEDLERILMEQADLDRKNPKRAKRTRRFLVAEGIYMNTGEMAPLPRLLELREKYKLRFFLDESVSFGTIGKNGHGITEYYNIDPAELDMISGSLEYAVGSIGGFCVGSHFIIEHQRLSGLGYCFSASAPPLMMAAAITSLDIMKKDPSIFQTLKSNCIFMHEKLNSLLISELRVFAHPESVVKHIRLAIPSGDKTKDEEILNDIVMQCEEANLALTTAAYLTDQEKKLPEPSIRITVNALLTKIEMESAIKTINKAAAAVLSSKCS